MVSVKYIATSLLLSYASLCSGAAMKLKDSLKPQTYEINPPVNDMAFLVVEYFDVDTKSYKQFDITVDLFSGLLPKTVGNFHQICNGVKALMPNYKSKDEAFVVTYKNKPVEIFEPEKYVQFGNVLPDVGSFSVYGYQFDDESFQVQFDRPGRLAMANKGPNSNGCEFFITTDTLHDLDNKYVAFGQVVEGLDTVVEKLQYLKDVELPEGFKHKAKIIFSTAIGLHHDGIKEDTKTYLTLVEDYRKGIINEKNSMVYDPMVRSQFYEDHMDLLDNTKKIVPNNKPIEAQSSQGKPGVRGSQSPIELLAIIVVKFMMIFAIGYGMNYFYTKNKSKILAKIGSVSKNAGDNKVVGLRHD